MRTYGVTSVVVAEAAATTTTTTSVSSGSVRATSWRNKWNSTLLGQQQWATIDGDKRNRKLGITRETKKMASTAAYSSSQPPVSLAVGLATPSAAATKQEAPSMLIIDLNSSSFVGDSLELVNHRSSPEQQEEEEEGDEEEEASAAREINQYSGGSSSSSSNINLGSIESHHSDRYNCHQNNCTRVHELCCQQMLAARKLNRKVKGCDFRMMKSRIMMANDSDNVELFRLRRRESHDDLLAPRNHHTASGCGNVNKQAKSPSSNDAQNIKENTEAKQEVGRECVHDQSSRQAQIIEEATTELKSSFRTTTTTTTRPTTKHRKSTIVARHACKSSKAANFLSSSLLLHQSHTTLDNGATKSPATASTTLSDLVYIIYMFIILTSVCVSVPRAAATNYWPLTRSAHKNQQTTVSPDQLKHQQQSAPRLGSHQLMIGQHYNNFSSIVPYSIVQDSDYGSMQDELVDQLEQQSAEQPPENSSQHELISVDQQRHHLQQRQQQQQLQQRQLGNDQQNYQQQLSHALKTAMAFDDESDTTRSDMSATNGGGDASTARQVSTESRALLQALSLDSNRLMLPQMQQIKSRFNQGCVGGTKCQFFAFCWMSGGSLGASCGLLMTCCVTPSRQEIQPGFYGPVVNDPYCGRSTSKINRIVGGTDASFGQFPWQAFVQVGGSRCGGALISSRHVVTAGHCVARSQHSPSSIKVTLGDYILNSDIESIPHEVFSVVEVLLHPNFRFTPQADRYDVAVLELDRTAAYKDNIKPICLPQKDAAFVGRVAYVAGWGALQAGSKLRPKVLQHVAVPVIENHVCESWHRRKGIDIRIYDEMMCAGYELGQRDACQGDSGGPLMLNQFGVWYLVGIVSAGYSCAKQYQPGIYHRVSSSSDWISSNIYQQGANK